MSKGAKPKDVFDVARIRQIIELMEQHELVEVDLQEGEEKIKLKRGGAVQMVAAPVAAAPAVAPAPT
ncbi:MAG: acetyl-CoA carboxylase, biotin carboxyl carrier protein, partial [Rubripirellula sp.]|nr:acetyl-CoA carboxylase, biotin carboxyl carrier protein [Rubripirellula sp.]